VISSVKYLSRAAHVDAAKQREAQKILAFFCFFNHVVNSQHISAFMQNGRC